ncbi:MAG: hypothetical protein A3F82_08070 [Deltaproteobacteria bacterium RIFCSPLOWO2_12_FULL_44_12]|nr:MAG: hypothetical protein A2712_07200 [Deltaproteobacteria bacterium RIFCSPHIGHO2_01_FULL_43_49]OGQ15733.1 MAG: hypothetical protein A3D22_05990 [Deltaproteobacteria bacterium RIFCSPHIGHO2_02_FULL_44_53]OGQ28702.1 MAG: hypothetical protein A3D98_00725 [Deltaproteobacteria bacterium RIFCSPHIGHO2_12_FULL_44_21]OGQ32025.1 MAG: hypothetical protein A2979_02935 [Deltaproteobacteria bacterium RIFCSPLOWO2_01_FULL_45_74]OGQ43638.1 MAG: hypothetical protein A3I70_03450 [Deltaproteobacteria bacterium 
MPKIKLCKDKGCHNAQTTQGLCRLHYLRNWKKLQAEKKKKAAKNLNRYVESILKRSPDRYVDQIKKDIRSKDFEDRVETEFGTEQDQFEVVESTTTEEEIDEIINDLKIEKDF